MPITASYRTSGNPYVDSLLGTLKWASSDLTFSFPESASVLGASYGYGETTHNFAPLNLVQRAAARSALDNYAAVSNLTFTEISETSTAEATLRFALSDLPHTAWAYFPSKAPEGGDTWLNQSSGAYSDPVKGNYANVTFLHELGHALGLEHPHERYVMPGNRDSLEYSVMSYRSYLGSTEHAYVNERWGFVQSLMMYDIAAIQHIYGANYTTNSGNTVYAWSPKTGEMFINGHGQGAPGANRVFQTVWDGGGIDTYSFAHYTTALSIDLRPGQWTTTSRQQLAQLRYDGSETAAGNIANALLHKGNAQSLIENAVGGSMNDLIIGNGAANALYGRSGNDRLYGGAGHDRLFGGAGADQLDGGAGSDHAFYSQAAATTIKTGAGLLVDLLLPYLNTGEAMGDTFTSIENLVGSGYSDNLRGDHGGNILQGLAGNDLIYGRSGNDRLYGGAGHDRLFGGAGADQLYGGAGSDTFVFLSVREASPWSRDVICDFTTGQDRVDLRSLDANSAILGNQAFSYIGGKSFSATACELRFDNGLVEGDIDGDGVGDLLVELLGVSALSGRDFLL
ncbi:M10 family metallopeptidase [Paracoccus sp. WLY502]|uniref:M10 family metallopeptidase n=1 Tax=Paracoccus yibinensis TaxID=3068891 RepID=UPI002796E0B3|nr:M10 family metallopeptidase [Paracoccus sp. WLY502]MDQ1902648.1 M10 family metallopeptidase [Paracoccus sp. WLY502]